MNDLFQKGASLHTIITFGIMTCVSAHVLCKLRIHSIVRSTVGCIFSKTSDSQLLTGFKISLTFLYKSIVDFMRKSTCNQLNLFFILMHKRLYQGVVCLHSCIFERNLIRCLARPLFSCLSINSENGVGTAEGEENNGK